MPIKDKFKDQLLNYIKRLLDDKQYDLNIISEGFNVLFMYDVLSPSIVKVNNELTFTGQTTYLTFNLFFDTQVSGIFKEMAVKKFFNIHGRLDCLTYVTEALNYMKTSKSNFSDAFGNEHIGKIQAINIRVLVNPVYVGFIENDDGLFKYIQLNDSQSISIIYSFLNLIKHSNELISEKMKTYIFDKINSMREDKETAKDPKLLIPKLFDFTESLNSVIVKCLISNRMISEAKSMTLMKSLGKTDLFYCQLANYCNFEMRSGIKGNPNSEVSEKIAKIISVFNMFSNKMHFIREYGKLLSDRLLKRKSLSVQFEHELVNQMKAIVGNSFVSSLTSMLYDVKISESVQIKFNSEYPKAVLDGVEMKVLVIQNSCWYLDDDFFQEFKVPLVIENYISTFSSFYVQSKTNVKLVPALLKADVDVTALKFPKKYVISMTLLQLCIMEIVEKSKEISLADLCIQIGLPEKIVKEHVYFLIEGMFNPKKEKASRILESSSGQGEDPKGQDVFKINYKFSSPTMKLSCLPVALKSRKNETEESKMKETDIKNMRKYMNDIIDSNLVRIMKGLKDQGVEHQQLVFETNNSINLFNANPQHIKERIESLIERKILERNKKNRNVYEYIS